MILVKNAPHIAGLRFRHFRGERDYPQLAAVLNASEAADGMVGHGYKPAPFVRQVTYRGPMHTLNFKEFIIEAQIPVDADG